LADFVKDKREEVGDDSAVLVGKMTIGDVLAIYRRRVDA
jgi:hypothetical protein